MESMLTLKGKTQKGKNRIRELGDDWCLLRIAEKVYFSPLPGPWWFVAPVLDKCDLNKHSRWVCSKNDPDFEIVESHIPTNWKNKF